MGKPTGFMEYPRVQPTSEAPAQRLLHWHEFVAPLSAQDAGQQGARCMDCGVPFCMSGCPVHNVIPDWNDLVYRQQWRHALDALHATNNFPEFTGRICPAPCEAACTLNINDTAVGIKSIEHAIIDYGWQQGWVTPQPPAQSSGKQVAIVGAGPAGLACAQQLARAGHAVTVFDKHEHPGGLLRFGIPDFKLEKHLIDRRVAQLRAEGVSFRMSTFIGDPTTAPAGLDALHPAQLHTSFDAIVLAGGAEKPRDLPIPGRELPGVHFAMDFLTQQNRSNAGIRIRQPISAQDKHVVVIGGGDTGSDCVGTSNRQGAASVTQIELMPQPPITEDKSLTWPNWPAKLRTSSSHEEGCERDWSISTVRFEGDGRVQRMHVARVAWLPDPGTGQLRMQARDQAPHTLPADLVLLAMGFVSPEPALLAAFGVSTDTRGNALADTTHYQTSTDKVFAAGDMRRGQSLVVWAIREGRDCARAVDAWLTETATHR